MRRLLPIVAVLIVLALASVSLVLAQSSPPYKDDPNAAVVETVNADGTVTVTAIYSDGVDVRYHSSHDGATIEDRLADASEVAIYQSFQTTQAVAAACKFLPNAYDYLRTKADAADTIYDAWPTMTNSQKDNAMRELIDTNAKVMDGLADLILCLREIENP